MTKVYSADLVAANNSSMITQLESTIQTNTKLISQLHNLHSESISNLVGSGYDVFRTNINLYIDALQKGNVLCENLIAGIKAANNNMLNFMEGYDMLDDSKIGEIEAALNAAKQLLDWLKDTHNVYDSKGNVIRTERNGTDAEIAEYEGIVAALSALLAKLKALAGEDRKDYQSVANVATDINAYGNAVGGVKLLGVYDTSKMTPEAAKQFEYYSQFWPDDLSPERIALMQAAFEMYDKNIHYEMSGRRGRKNENGEYDILDCSSFIAAVYEAAGLNLSTSLDNTNTETLRKNNDFSYIDFSELRPGDIMEWGDYSAGGGNHVVMYIGQDPVTGEHYYIHCSSSNTNENRGDFDSIGIESMEWAHSHKKGWDYSIFLRYDGLTN